MTRGNGSNQHFDGTGAAAGGSIGSVERVFPNRVVGWVRRFLSRGSFMVNIDNTDHPVKPRFAQRDDLDSAGLDALGFEADLAASAADGVEVSVACVDGEGRRVVLPFSGAQPEEPPVAGPATGFVDAASATEVSGWVPSRFRGRKFFVEIDGVPQPIHPRFFPRADLIEASVDGVGFAAYIDARMPDFAVSCGVFAGAADANKTYLVFSSNGTTSGRVSESHPDRVILTAQELGEIAGAIEADSLPYASFVRKFAPALANAGVTFDVLFVDGSLGSVSTRYRIYNLADGLRELGYTTLYARPDTVNLKNLSNLKARIVVFFRAPLDDNYQFLVKTFRANGSRIVFDVDDLVFDESIISSIDGVRYLSENDMEGYVWGVRHYRRFAVEADLVTAATQFLADYASTTLGCKAIHIRNTIGKAYIDHYSNDSQPAREGKGFVVGYYSGSKTHQADFQEAYPGIRRFLRTYHDAVLRVVGMLDLEEFPDLHSVRDRIVTVPMLPYHEMIADLRNCDAIIAPLVSGNPFCEAKSELKFFEAALVGRPCVASATATFTSATAGGQYGYIARTEDEWFEALSQLYLSPQHRGKIARQARAYVQANYSYAVAGREAAAAYFGLPALPAPASAVARNAAKAGKTLSVGVLIPAIVVGGGGHRKILKFCHDWAHEGHQVTLYVDSTDSPEAIRRQIYAYFYEFPCDIRAYRGSVDRHSFLVCTHWKTAFSLRNYPERHKVIYFVQDFEAMFDAASTNYVKAIATYGLGFNIACYGQWVADRLRRELKDLRPGVVPFSMDQGLYRDNPRAAKVIDVLFFARPSQPRRCFELGVEALKQVYKSNSAVRIGLYGEDVYGDLGFPFYNFGLVKNVAKLADMYQKSRVGICFSSTNPSLVGYEMVACGTALVDLRLPGCEVNFDGDSFVYYADPTPESIYASIAAALGNEAERARRAKVGMAFVSAMPDDSVIGHRLLEIVASIQAKG